MPYIIPGTNIELIPGENRYRGALKPLIDSYLSGQLSLPELERRSFAKILELPIDQLVDPSKITDQSIKKGISDLYTYGAQGLIDQLKTIQQAAQAGVDPSVLRSYINQHIDNVVNKPGTPSAGLQNIIDSIPQQVQINKQNEELKNQRSQFETQILGKPGATIQEALANPAALVGQLSKQIDERETQLFGKVGSSLEEALTSPSGEIGQLAEALRKQQSDVFKRELAPTINRNLNAQGLYDSGSNVELQARALGDLESRRQGTLLQSALDARNQLASQRGSLAESAAGAVNSLQNLSRSDLLGGLGAQQQAIMGGIDYNRAIISFNLQRQLEQERAQLARDLSQYRGGGSGGVMGGLAGAIGGASLGFAAGGPYGAILGGLGGGLAGAYGSQGTGAGLIGIGGAANNLQQSIFSR